uniref:F-box domain-containing protein n=1 Tax=Setaria italica TaxID=4555 RepID=K3YLE5_SETIT
MEPHKNRNRKRKETHGGSSTGDRLSALPDCLLHEIMSRMKARQTVQTCVLSRRWRHLWRSAPCLDLDQTEFFESSYGHPTQEQLDRFQDFGDSLLLNREDGSGLDTLSLHLLDTHASRTDAGRWMRYAFNYCSLRALRYEIFGGGSHTWIKMPPDLGPSLTVLHLANVSLDERFAEVVGSVCVALEVMELEECKICCRSVTSNSLGSLVIDDCYIDNGGHDDDHDDDQLVITAPRLTSLRILDWGTQLISVNEMLSLEKASILIGYPEFKTSFRNYQLKLLSTLYNVTSLELSGFLQKILPDVKPVEFPTFINLRTLLLFDCSFFQEMNYFGFSDNFQLLGPLLQNSPNLEKVTMRSQLVTYMNPSRWKQLRGSAIFKRPKFAELVYNNGDDIQELVHFLLGISDRAPKNILALTKV